MSTAKPVDLVVKHPSCVEVRGDETAFEMFLTAIFSAFQKRDKFKSITYAEASDHARLCQTLLENSWIIALVKEELQGHSDEVLNPFIVDASIPFEYRLVWWIILHQLDLYKSKPPARLVSETTQRTLAYNFLIENVKSAAQLPLYQLLIDSALVRLKEYMADEAIAPAASLSAELPVPTAETGKAADAPEVSRTASADTGPETTLAEIPKKEETGEGGDVAMKDREEREASTPRTPRTPPTPAGDTHDKELDTGNDDTKDTEFGKNGEGKQPDMEVPKDPKKKRKPKRVRGAAGAAETQKPELHGKMTFFADTIQVLVNCHATEEVLGRWEALLDCIKIAFTERSATPLATIQMAGGLYERVCNFVDLVKVAFLGDKLSDDAEECYLEAARVTFTQNPDHIGGLMPAKDLAVIYKKMMDKCGHDSQDWCGFKK